MTSDDLKMILKILFSRHWRCILPKWRENRRFSNFGPDQAKVLVFRHNNFSCGANNL
jgi:hypothetical protein